MLLGFFSILDGMISNLGVVFGIKRGSRIGISDSEVLICGEGIFVLTGSRLLHAAEKIIPEAKVSLEIELVSRFPTPVKCERISVSLQCKVR